MENPIERITESPKGAPECIGNHKLYIYLCDFAKRCPLSFRPCSGQCSWKKTRGLAVSLGVSGGSRPRPIRGWVADLFCVKTRGVGRGDFVTLFRVSCQKTVQSQIIFPVD